jgi:hypothetical protein
VESTATHTATLSPSCLIEISRGAGRCRDRINDGYW